MFDHSGRKCQKYGHLPAADSLQAALRAIPTPMPAM